MDKASPSSAAENLLIEEREEVMVTKKGRCLRKTHFLKPFVTSTKDGSVSELPRRDYQQRPSSDFSLELKRFSSQISFSGFWFAEGPFLSWVEKMEALHAPTWRKAGIFDAIKASTYNISRNTALLLSVTEKWCPETKSFVFPWGEATITLEDVMVLLGFSVLGSPIFAPLESSEMRDAVEKLDKAISETKCSGNYVRVSSWISRFSGRGGQMEHEAFLVSWLSLFVFPGTARRGISKYVTPIAVRLARGERIALAPVVLASLYRDLGRICDFSREKCADKINFKSLFKLVQVWTWERFRNTRPKAREIPKGGPRIAQWGALPQRNKMRLSFDDFEWRPYTKPLKNWNPLRFYLEDAMWVTVDDNVDDEFASFARCVTVSQLVGDGFLEDYFPNRVAMQFGLAQALPALVSRHRNCTEKEAWNDYSKSLDGLKLYMPCRLDRGSVTARYRVWWLNSVSKFLGSAEMQKETSETFTARNKSDHDDDDDDDGDIGASPKVLPLSHVVQKLEEGLSAKRKISRMHRLVKQDKIGGLANGRVSSGRKMNKKKEDFTNKRSINKPVQLKRAHEDDDESSMDDEDDNITIDASPKVLPFSHMVQKLEEGFSSKRRRSRMHRLVKQDKIGGLVNSRVSSGWKMNKTSEDFTNKRSINKPVHLKQSIYKPVQLKKSIYKPVQLPQSIYKPVQLKQSIYKPVNLPQSIYKPVQLKQSMYKPVQLPQNIYKPVQLPQSIYKPVQLKQSIYKPVQMKRANEDDNESSMDEEDDNITIARRIGSRKKYSSDAENNVGDASQTLGKRTRRYLAVDSDDDSEPFKKHASIEVEQRREKDDETASKSQTKREILNDFEVDVIGNTAEKKSIIDGEQHNGSVVQGIGRDGTKKSECLVQEDGEKQRCNEKLCSEVKKEEELDERLKQRKLAVKEIALKLEARIAEMEKTLAMITVWKTRGNQTKNGVSA
ncbi:hypothetical protein CARUB_v10012136mg [Capsella rubella]|uniref:Aminotransferase-like plant mobile domain-containing protein n=1 Tax=Capsella rubella TaxID=81985 RepID=R0GTP3_9BRAS|nr:uncharacterized protein LOC17900600 [Capsella rubella]EOA39176.1 hypothetical protein CARUB_v10012136mg [Capsella rubella]